MRRRQRPGASSPPPRLVPTPPASVGGARTRARWTRIVRALTALGILCGALLGTALMTEPARADWQCAVGGGDVANAGPELPGAGLTSLIPLVREDVDPAGNPQQIQRSETDYSLWEIMQVRGLRWSYTPVELGDDWDPKHPDQNQEEQCSLMDAAGTYVAQLLWEGARFIGGGAIAVKQRATSEAPFQEFYSAQEGLIDNLTQNVFLPALTLGVIVTGYWVATRIHRRRDARETYAGVIGAAVIVVMLCAVLIGGNYTRLTAAIDHYSSEFNSAAMNLAGVDNSNDRTGPCYIPDHPINGQGGDGHLAYNRGKRDTSCMLYQVLLFNPWANGQFGTSSPVLADSMTFDKNYCGDKSDPSKVNSWYRCFKEDRPRAANNSGQRTKINLAAQQIISQGYTTNELIRSNPSRPDSQGPVISRHHELWKGVQYAVRDYQESKYDYWRGTQPTSRMATAIGAFVVNLIGFIFVGGIAILTLFWHGVLFIAWILLPITAAAAIFPPARRILRMHLGIMVQAIFLRNVFGLVLAILIAILNALQISHGNLAAKIFLMILAAVGLWKVLTALRGGLLFSSSEEATAMTTVSERNLATDAGRGLAVAGAAGAIRRADGTARPATRYFEVAPGMSRGMARAGGSDGAVESRGMRWNGSGQAETGTWRTRRPATRPAARPARDGQTVEPPAGATARPMRRPRRPESDRGRR